jgi:hypothetical protein
MSFTSKNNKNNFIFPLICAAVPVIGVTYSIFKNPENELKEFRESPIGLSLMMGFFLLLFGYFVSRYFFDNKVKLIIDTKGFWTVKIGEIEWNNVWYVHQIEQKGKYTTQILIIKLKENDQEIKIDTTYYDKTSEEIIEAFIHYSKRFNIQFLGKEIQKSSVW